MSVANKAAAPEGAAASHKEDNKVSSNVVTIPDWRQAVVKWFAGGPKPTFGVLRTAAQFGIEPHMPRSSKDRVVRLGLTGFDIEDIVAAVPELNPIHIVETVDDIPGEARSIVDLHLQGLTPIDIAAMAGVSRPKVYYWLAKLDVKPNKRSRDELTARQRDQVVDAYRAGEPMAGIARRYNISYDQVRYAVQKQEAA